METRTLQIVIGDDPPPRLDKALSRDVPEDAALSRTRLARLIDDGAVRRGEDVLRAKSRVAAGDVIEITLPPPEIADLVAQDIPLNIVHEDADLIVVNKPAGMVVHPAPGAPDGTLANALMFHCGDSLAGIGGEQRPGIVHRIDKDTTGLLVAAKTDRAHHALSDQFRKHSAERAYCALCYGVPDVGDPRLRGLRGVSVEVGGTICITSGLDRHPSHRQRQAVTFDGGRHAVTRLTVQNSFGTPPTLSLVECRLQTGRTHQIRVHMAYAGHALVGDQTYGRPRKLAKGSLPDAAAQAVASFPRQALHARLLGFEHPANGAWMRFEAPLPDDFADLIETLAPEI
jgi:23S rRNA pseudouridine1911/1915/1917 synthase